jgi:hypothetical protein
MIKRPNEMLVFMRNSMINELHSAISMYNEYSQKEHVRHFLQRVASTRGYSIDLKCEESFYLYGRQINATHVKIKEADEGFIIRIFKIDGELQYWCDHYMLRTDKENEEEARQEIEAERRMSLYNSGYRDF